MKMRCPQCGVKGTVEGDYIGRKVKCPKCQEIFVFDPPEVEEVPEALFEEENSDVEAPVAEVTQEDDPVIEEVVQDDTVVEEEPVLPPVEEEAAVEDIVASFDEPELSAEDDVDETAEEEILVEEEIEAVEEEQEEESIDSGDFDEIFDDTSGDDSFARQEEELLIDEQESESSQEEDIVLEPSADELVLDEDLEFEEGPEFLEVIDDNEDEIVHDDSEVVLDDAVAASAVAVAEKKPVKKAKKKKQPIPEYSLSSFTISGVLKEAWRLTKGAKASVWAASIVYCILFGGLAVGVEFLRPQLCELLTEIQNCWASFGLEMLLSFISSVLAAGMIMIGINRVGEKTYSWKQLFSGLPKMISLLIAFILMGLMVISGFVLLVLPGIYLAVGYCMTLPLIIDQGMHPWQAMEASRRAVHKVWWKVFIIFILMQFIFILAMIPFGVGIIWVNPMYIVLFGVIYRALYGVSAQKSA